MMPAGRYYIGDLCYYFQDDEWTEVCELTIKDNECIEGEFEMRDGRRFAMYGTAFGDGTYKDQIGRSYCVDSGTIGCVMLKEGEKAPWGGHEHVFDKPFHTFGDERPRATHWGSEAPHLICFGKVKIDTNPPFEDLEESHEYDEAE